MGENSIDKGTGKRYKRRYILHDLHEILAVLRAGAADAVRNILFLFYVNPSGRSLSKSVDLTPS